VDHSAEGTSAKQIILWDETGTFVGGSERWKMIQKRWRNGLEVFDRGVEPTDVQSKSAIFIEPNTLRTAQEAAAWAKRLNPLLVARAKAGKESIVVVLGSKVASAAAKNKLTESDWLGVPAFGDRSFRKQLPLAVLVARLPVVLQGDSSRMEQWGQKLAGTARPLGDVLADWCPEPEAAIDRIVRHLQQKAKDGALLGDVIPPIEIALNELSLTFGAEQDWKQVFDTAGLPDGKKPFWG